MLAQLEVVGLERAAARVGRRVAQLDAVEPDPEGARLLADRRLRPDQHRHHELPVAQPAGGADRSLLEPLRVDHPAPFPFTFA